MLRALLETAVPHRCLACGARGAPLWCSRCAMQAAALRVSPDCHRCGAAGSGAHACWMEPAPVDGTVVVYRYRGVVATTVVAAKVRGAGAAWPALGGRLAAVVADADTGVQPDVVTWVPADARRRRQRGFDHAEALARPVARRLRRPAAALLDARPGRPDQATRPVATRRVVPLEAFRATTTLTGAVVLLVDDVVTTGATAWAAAAAMRRAGADVVLLAALARAGTHELGPAETSERPVPSSGPGASVGDPAPRRSPCT